ncbi:uncharacterized protein LOC142341147 [Convolutriloba macropyga]|uniref:uncharacterized protein LOC142341147 n=1 Tax=Convolutriloba macropyga TaxID=536237 RepID=UPI003F51DCA3
MVHLHCEQNQEKFWSLVVAADRYCQWNGPNETLWFVALMNLQESVPMVTPSYNWWEPPNIDKDWLFPGAIATEPPQPHAIFGGDDSALVIRPHTSLIVSVLMVVVASGFICSSELS